MNLAAALSLFLSPRIFSDYGNDWDWDLNMTTRRSLILLASGHAFDLVYLLYTTKFQFKTCIVSLLLIIAGSFAGGVSQYYMITAYCFILHSITQYIALHYDGQRESDQQDSTDEEERKYKKELQSQEHIMSLRYTMYPYNYYISSSCTQDKINSSQLK